MTFLPTLFSLLVSGCVAGVFISLLLSGMLDGVARLLYIYLGWSIGGELRDMGIEQTER